MRSIKELLQEQGYLSRKQIKKYAEEIELEYTIVIKILTDLGISFRHIEPKEVINPEIIEYEKCVLCEKETNVKKNEKIEYRSHYVTGVGQLCPECFKEI